MIDFYRFLYFAYKIAWHCKIVITPEECVTELQRVNIRHKSGSVSLWLTRRVCTISDCGPRVPCEKRNSDLFYRAAACRCPDHKISVKIQTLSCKKGRIGGDPLQGVTQRRADRTHKTTSFHLTVQDRKPRGQVILVLHH